MSLNPGEIDFHGQVVLVTGAGKGLGRALALAFARCGAGVAINDLTAINLDGTAEQIAAAGGQARSYVADIAKAMVAQAMVADIEADWGRLDILVNNAAVAPRAPLLSIDEWDWVRTMEVNLGGPLWLLQGAARLMRAGGGGCILNITARPAWLETLSHRAAYQASQWGLAGFTRAAAPELAGEHIRANALALGALQAGPAGDPADQPRGWEEGVSGRVSTLAEVVDQVLWLCSPAAGHLTGQVLDGEEGLPVWRANSSTR